MEFYRILSFVIIGFLCDASGLLSMNEQCSTNIPPCFQSKKHGFGQLIFRNSDKSSCEEDLIRVKSLIKKKTTRIEEKKDQCKPAFNQSEIVPNVNFTVKQHPESQRYRFIIKNKDDAPLWQKILTYAENPFDIYKRMPLVVYENLKGALDIATEELKKLKDVDPRAIEHITNYTSLVYASFHGKEKDVLSVLNKSGITLNINQKSVATRLFQCHDTRHFMRKIHNNKYHDKLKDALDNFDSNIHPENIIHNLFEELKKSMQKDSYQEDPENSIPCSLNYLKEINNQIAKSIEYLNPPASQKELKLSIKNSLQNHMQNKKITKFIEENKIYIEKIRKTMILLQDSTLNNGTNLLNRLESVKKTTDSLEKTLWEYDQNLQKFDHENIRSSAFLGNNNYKNASKEEFEKISEKINKKEKNEDDLTDILLFFMHKDAYLKSLLDQYRQAPQKGNLPLQLYQRVGKTLAFHIEKFLSDAHGIDNTAYADYLKIFKAMIINNTQYIVNSIESGQDLSFIELSDQDTN